MSDIKVVVFRLNAEICGVESNQVQEIVKYQEMTRLLKMPKFIDGVITIRGNIIPVINLNTRFGIGQTDITKKTKIIISNIEGNLAGFLVNDVTEMLSLPENDIEAPPEIILKSGNEHLSGIGKVGDKVISILNLNKILENAEIKKIGKLNKSKSA